MGNAFLLATGYWLLTTVYCLLLSFIIHHSAFIISKSLASAYIIHACDQRM